MTQITVSTFAAANHALKQRDLRQALYDEALLERGASADPNDPPKLDVGTQRTN